MERVVVLTAVSYGHPVTSLSTGARPDVCSSRANPGVGASSVHDEAVC